MAANSLNGIVLPDDIVWQDELNWSHVEQKRTLTLTGALVIEEAKRIKGRRITLVGGVDHAWIKRSTLLQLRVLIETVDNNLTLIYNNNTYTVRFLRDGFTSPIEHSQVVECSNPSQDALYYVKIKLLEVA